MPCKNAILIERLLMHAAVLQALLNLTEAVFDTTVAVKPRGSGFYCIPEAPGGICPRVVARAGQFGLPWRGLGIMT